MASVFTCLGDCADFDLLNDCGADGASAATPAPTRAAASADGHDVGRGVGAGNNRASESGSRRASDASCAADREYFDQVSNSATQYSGFCCPARSLACFGKNLINRMCGCCLVTLNLAVNIMYNSMCISCVSVPYNYGHGHTEFM